MVEKLFLSNSAYPRKFFKGAPYYEFGCNSYKCQLSNPQELGENDVVSAAKPHLFISQEIKYIKL
jgi:hypothetical protein